MKFILDDNSDDSNNKNKKCVEWADETAFQGRILKDLNKTGMMDKRMRESKQPKQFPEGLEVV